MTKKLFNQNAKYSQELIDLIEPNFIFGSKSLNRLNNSEKNSYNCDDKTKKIEELKQKINSIENCNLKDNSTNLVLGIGNINSPIMLIGESPDKEEDKSGLAFQGDVGGLLKKMLKAINLELNKVYLSYSINFRPRR